MRLADKESVASAFGRASHSYDQAAGLQRKVADRLIAPILAKPVGDTVETQRQILDAGCGTGYISQQLKNQTNHIVTALDLSNAMLLKAEDKDCAHQYIEGDIESLPFADATFDEVVSSLAVQWCHDFQKAMSELLRVLKPGGTLRVSTLANPSLYELKDAFAHIDDAQHVVDFLPQSVIAGTLEILGQENVRLDFYRETLVFDGIIPLLKSLQGIGATALSDRKKGLMGKSQLQRLSTIYGSQSGLYPLTYQLVEIIIIK